MVVLALPGLAGCESATERFARQLHALQRDVTNERAQLAATLRTVRLRRAGDAQLLSREIDALSATLTQIASLKPPSQATAAFASYNAAYAQLVAHLKRFADALRLGKRRALTLIGQAAQDAAGAVQRADDALQSELH